MMSSQTMIFQDTTAQDATTQAMSSLEVSSLVPSLETTADRLTSAVIATETSLLDGATPQARLRQLLPQLFQPDARSGTPYLKFQLTDDRAALVSLEQVQEALLLPARMITPIPNLPPCVLGWMNSRNQVLCVVDLPQLLQLPALARNQQQYPIIVVRFLASELASATQPSTAPTEPSLLGLMVHQVRGIERLVSEQIQPSIDNLPKTLTPFLQGCVIQAEEAIPVLSIAAIATAPALTQR